MRRPSLTTAELYAGVDIGHRRRILEVPRCGPSKNGDGRSVSPQRVLSLCLREAHEFHEIYTDHLRFSHNCDRDRIRLRRMILNLASQHRYFYVGVTRYMRRRWIGDARRSRYHLEDTIPGHRWAKDFDGQLKWARMHVLLFLPVAITLVEREIVEWCRSTGCPIYQRCANSTSGGGHFNCHAPGFLYLLLSCKLTSLQAAESIKISSDDCGGESSAKRRRESGDSRGAAETIEISSDDSDGDLAILSS